ncbi:glycosyltransferase family 4 protein [Ornithinimicrobium tianjinense]|uniref:glycosyltransferase family 4 protein n=1 Tax=Ornithinimicrobium tianjinense TaxID=1195761 RepID=UPI0016652BF0|nr:glycosyltransferase family 4 protein [Ornithinimicrobium tianjinense]
MERHIATLARAQAEAGHDVTVVGGSQARMRVAMAATGVRTLSGDTLRQAAESVSRAGHPDVVHAHMTAGELTASLASRAPLVATRHFARRRGATTIGRASAMVIRRRLRRQIAISRFVASAIDGSSTVVYPGVGTDNDASTHTRPTALVVQRLQPEKNTDVAVRGFAAGAPAEWTLEIVGRGPELNMLQDLVRDLGIADRTTFLGFRDDVPDLMRSASVLLAPCEVEGLGLSVLEAMSHGLPVIASRAGAHPETVGLAADAQLFEPGDAQDAASMLARMCADATLRARYGAQLAQVQRTNFTPQAQAEATEAVYQQVLA